MKYIIFTFALLALLFASCSENVDGNDYDDIKYNQNIYLFKRDDFELYKGSGKIYMRDYNADPYRENPENMLEVGIVNNGKITISFPKTIDSRFLTTKLNSEFDTEPEDVETLFYKASFMLMDNNGNYVGDLDYSSAAGIDSRSGIQFWYFSEDAKLKDEDVPIYVSPGVAYISPKAFDRIDAKKGWNKIYWANQSGYYSYSILSENSYGPPVSWWIYID